MLNMKRLLLFVGLLSVALIFSTPMANAQEGWGGSGGGQPEAPAADSEEGESEEPVVRDGLYDKISTKQKEILAYDHLREADIFWQKRVWRVIDTRQKMNLPFVYPEKPFIQTLLDIVEENDSEVNIFMDDTFSEKITLSDVETRLNSVDTITVIDPDTYQEHTKIIKNDFNWTAVSKFRVKEDWVFDEETSTMVVRILAIAPIMDVIDDNGNYRGQQAMFYAYYPDFRPYLMKHEVFNPVNDAQRMTWDDIFEMRLFSSFIMKESNIQDRRIKDYSTGQDALLESERIKEEIFTTEHNLWSY